MIIVISGPCRWTPPAVHHWWPCSSVSALSVRPPAGQSAGGSSGRSSLRTQRDFQRPKKRSKSLLSTFLPLSSLTPSVSASNVVFDLSKCPLSGEPSLPAPSIIHVRLREFFVWWKQTSMHFILSPTTFSSISSSKILFSLESAFTRAFSRSFSIMLSFRATSSYFLSASPARYFASWQSVIISLSSQSYQPHQFYSRFLNSP